ncbi:hypothetical protein X777_00747 [Ooceraea biroi]|uniref:Chitin-binding type-2 domain-containing protein n=1 Tax=Ooceraea biroi TaxID=2015173 RepID=A0A026WNM6_OOCBI|nr:hypothetical protein X777_00747 [Ooceraea biroi]
MSGDRPTVRREMKEAESVVQEESSLQRVQADVNITGQAQQRIITDYQAFLNEFYGRSLRHSDRNQQYRQDRKYQESKLSTAYQKVRSHIANSHNSDSAYTSLTSIPKTSFSCRGRKGVFADVETKCQVFHDCSDWSKVSSLCPPGTAFCEANKRCEWFDTVRCKQ